MTDHCGLSGDQRPASSRQQVASDRRRPGQASQAPADKLQSMPALVVLDRMPIPVLAIDGHGIILFANRAFIAMLGHTQDSIEQLTFPEVFREPVDEPMAILRGAYADELVELAHNEGFTVQATMSKSAMLRCDDDLALVTFQDLTERLWTDDHDRQT